MNTDNLKDVIQAYLNHFNLINDNEHREYYKWEAYQCFADKLTEKPELTETIRECFRELFAGDGGDIVKRQGRLESFSLL